MIKIALLIAVLILVVLLILRYNESEKVSNATIFKVFLLLLSIAGLYKYQTNNFQDRVTSLLNSYKEGKTLICKDVEISQKEYIYQSGTMVFLSKKSIVEKYLVQDCKTKE